MASWYYSVGGKAEGPVSDEFLLEGLKTGRFTLVDLVFREGDASWCTLGEIPEFREAFQALPPPVVKSPVDEWTHEVDDSGEKSTAALHSSSSHPTDSAHHPSWVVLKKKGAGFEQVGPFSAEQILEGLATGEVEYSQYAWKSGYKRWVRIGNLPEFDRRKRDRDGDPVNQIVPLPDSSAPFPALTQEELMESVVRFDRTQVISTALLKELPPSDAAGDDLVSKDDLSIVVMNPTKTKANANPPREQAQAPKPSPAAMPTAARTSAAVDENLDETDDDDDGGDNEDDDVTDVTGAAHLSSLKVQNVEREHVPASERPPRPQFDAPKPPPIPTSSRMSAQQPPPLESVHSPFDEDDLTPTQAGRPLPGDPQTGAFTHPHEEEVPVEAPIKTRPPIWKRAARLFVAGAAAGVLVVVALPYLMPSEDGSEEATQESAPESADNSLPSEAPSGVHKANPADGASGAAAASAPPDQSLSVSGAGGADLAAQGLNGDPNAVLPPAGGMESQAGAPTAAGNAAASAATAAAPSEPPVATSNPNSDVLAGIQAVPPGAGPATSLEVLPVKLSSATPFIVVQSNAGVGQKLWVRLKARSGEILRLPSYDRTVSILRAAGEIPAVDLAKLNLPRGSYRVDVAAGELRKSSQIFVGSREGFDAEMEKHLKTLAFQQQNEKKTLFYTAKKFEGLAKTLSDSFQKNKTQNSKWKEFYSTWRKEVKTATEGLLALADTSASAVFAYPDEVKSLRAAIDSLGEQARLLDVAVQQQRDVASQKPLAIIREFSRIRQEVALISSRR